MEYIKIPPEPEPLLIFTVPLPAGYPNPWFVNLQSTIEPFISTVTSAVAILVFEPSNEIVGVVYPIPPFCIWM